MPYYDRDALDNLAAGLDQAHVVQNLLRTRLVFREYREAVGREHACHGLLRRTDLILHSIDRIFEAIPPGLDGIPSRSSCHDATAHLQAACFNTFGSLDNLAWLWVHERSVLSSSGAPLRPSQVGLGQKYNHVRTSLSQPIQEYLLSIDGWLQRLIAYRDALAHQVPLYVPPFSVLDKNVREYRSLDESEPLALRAQDWVQLEQIAKRKAELEFFQPMMAGSISDEFRPILFHFQVIADHATVVELGNLIVDELDKE